MHFFGPRFLLILQFQPQGTVIALTAIQKFIDTLIVVNDAQRKLPSQIAIILPPAEGDDVREDKRDEEFRLELQQHYIVELPKHLKNVAAPSPRRPPPPPRPPANKPAEKHAKPVVRSIVKPPRGAAGGIKPPVKPPVKPTPPQVVNKKFIPATPLPNAITSNVYKKILIQLCSGDIANFLPARSTRPPYACILVTDAAIELDGSGGPDDIAIHAAAGPLLQQALNDIKQTDDYSNTRTSVWTTGSFSLGYIRVRRIIHAVGPLYLGRASDASKSQKEVDLAATYRNVFEEAIKPENNAANMMVAFSFISLPRNNFPVDRGTEIALQAVVDFIDRGAIGGINHIMFVVQRDTDAAVDPFKNSLKTLIPGTGTGADKNTDTESDTSEDVATGPPIPSSSAPKPTSKKTKAQIAKEAKAKKDLAAKNKAKDAAKKAVHKAARDGDREEERRVDEARLRVQLLKVLTPRGPGSAEKQEEWLETQAEENKRRLKQYEKNMEQLKTETALRKKAEREKKAADKKTAGKKKTSKATTTGNTEKEPGSSSSSDTPLAQVAYETRAEASRKKAATEKAAQKKKTSTSRTNRTEPNPSSSSRKIPLAQVARETRAEAARKKAAPEKANADAAAKKTSSSKTPTPKVLALKRPAAILPPKKATAQTIGGVIVISGSGLNERLPSPSKISLPRETRSQKIARENGEKRGRDEAENVGGNPRPKRARTA
ncbi:hypothetical protein BKA65DRAFT_228987 [Rhexocercosporidium sp. MPI-PUGE-AT-0058]|nr:hypothetical protein BKA65DRAFT_228987 [Rhexocercosporidium sp. MPI-PUGE-AT-0058]